MSESKTIDLETLAGELRAFAHERDWEQFHSPKNLAMALSVEAAELVECFQWLSEAQSAALNEGQHRAVAQELADIMIYGIRLADRLNIDLSAEIPEKIRLNAIKYPVDKARGIAKKI